MTKFRDTGKKDQFWVGFGPVLGRNGQKWNFAQKSGTATFLHFWISVQKFHRKLMNGFREICVTDKRTDGTEFIGPWRRCRCPINNVKLPPGHAVRRKALWSNEPSHGHAVRRKALWHNEPSPGHAVRRKALWHNEPIPGYAVKKMKSWPKLKEICLKIIVQIDSFYLVLL